MLPRFMFCLMILADYASAGDAIPLPFEGLYESPGSIAREKVSADQWRDIPQDVRMRIVMDDDIVELQLLIAVTLPAGSAGPSSYTITNNMWLVKKKGQPEHAEFGRVYFDVYKINRLSERFEDVGDGYCNASECRYSYITAKPDHQQRYRSYITWQQQHVGTEFEQTGDLSARNTADSEWTIYKIWENNFKLNRQGP